MNSSSQNFESGSPPSARQRSKLSLHSHLDLIRQQQQTRLPDNEDNDGEDYTNNNNSNNNNRSIGARNPSGSVAPAQGAVFNVDEEDVESDDFIPLAETSSHIVKGQATSPGPLSRSTDLSNASNFEKHSGVVSPEIQTSSLQRKSKDSTTTSQSSASNLARNNTRVGRSRFASSMYDLAEDGVRSDSEDSETTISTTLDSAQLMAMAKFRQQQVFLNIIANACLVPLIVCDSRGVIRSVNRETSDLFQYERWMLIGRNVKMLMDEKTAAKHDYYLKRYDTTKMPRILGEKRTGVAGRRKDGTMFPITLRVQEMDDGENPIYIGFIQDMSMSREVDRLRTLVDNMLPPNMAQRLRETNGDASQIADEVTGTAIFIDIIGFTEWCQTATPKEVVTLVTGIFKKFDQIAKRYEITHLKNVGDCWIGICYGSNILDGPLRVCEMALDALDYIRAKEKLQIRVGINTGPMVVGLISTEHLSFDAFGATVNIASRLQNYAPPMHAIVSKATFEQTSHRYHYRQPLQLDVKGVGEMPGYVLEDRK